MKIVVRKITFFLWAVKLNLRVRREAEWSFESKERLGTIYTAPRDSIVQRTPSTVGGSIARYTKKRDRHRRSIAHAWVGFDPAIPMCEDFSRPSVRQRKDITAVIHRSLTSIFANKAGPWFSTPSSRKLTVLRNSSAFVTILGEIGNQQHWEKPSHNQPVELQGDSGGKVNILGGDSVGNCEKKDVHMIMCLILIGYRDGDVWIRFPELNPLCRLTQKRELLKNPTKIEEIQEKKILTGIEPLKLAF